MKENHCTQPNNLQNSKLHTQFGQNQASLLLKLKGILNNKNVYLQMQHEKKYHRKVQKIKNNYELYLGEHQKKLSTLKSTNYLYSVLETLIKQKENLFFQQLKEFKQKNENYQKQIQVSANIKIKNHQKIQKCSIKGLSIKIMLKSIQNIKNSIQICVLNESYSKIKQCKSEKNKNSEIKDISINIENMRIMNFNCFQQQQLQIKLSQNSLGHQVLDFSVFQNPVFPKESLHIETYQNQKKLREQLNKLNIQFHSKISKYQAIKQDIYAKMDIFFASHSCKDQQPIMNSFKNNSIKAQETFKMQKQQELRASHSFHDEDKQITDDAIIQLMQRNEQLEEEIDKIQTTVEGLLKMAISDRNINPELVVILREVKDILAPNPLGHSLIMQ